MRWIGYVATILWWSGVVRSLSSLNRGHSYKISPKPCRVAGPNGSINNGTCMFVWECIKSEGTHVGVCVDTFMFGSCCVHNETVKYSAADAAGGGGGDNKQHNNADAGDETAGADFYLQQRLPPSPSSSSSSSAAIAAAATTSLSSSKSPEKEQQVNNHHHQQHRPNIVGDKEEEEEESNNLFDNKFNEAAAVDTLVVSSSAGISSSIVAIIRPPASVASIMSNEQPNEIQNSLRTRPSVVHPAGTADGGTWNYPVEKNNEEAAADNSKEITHQHYSVLGHHHQQQQHQTSVYRPYLLHDKPQQQQLKLTSTYRPIGVSEHDREKDARPNFVSKPDVIKRPTKSRTSTPKPIIVHPSQHQAHNTYTSSTSESGSETIHWRVTTEPAFVTKLSTTPSASASMSTKSGVNNNNGASSAIEAEEPDFWSEQSSSSPVQSHWSDVQDLLANEPERYHDRPSFELTEFQHQQSTEYDKASIGAAHYITTDDLGTSLTRPRPTRRRKPSLAAAGSATTAALFFSDRSKNRPSPATIIISSPSTTTTTTTTTTATTATRDSDTLFSTERSTTTTTMATMTSPPDIMTAATTALPTSPTTIKTRTISAAVGDNEKTECGLPALFPRPETRIVGGKDAPFGRWPWQVSVRRTSFFGFSSTHRCGGAVLNANWIATAGHCVDDLLTSQIRIRVGDYDFSSVQERLPYVERAIAKKVVHPKYNFFTYEYDLALVRLESPLTFAPHISPICLPASEDLLIGENATVTGWGRLSEGGTLPSVLQEVSVPIVSNDRCKTMFLRAGRHEFIPDIFLCAGYETGGQDSCQGDSGGPLQVRGKDGRYFLAGIISWGIGCAEANLPGVCTRISKFVPWILKNVT